MGTEKNFMTAGTEIEGLLDKKAQVLDKVANIISEACVGRSKTGKIGSLDNDINNLIKNLPYEDQIVVLRKIVINLTCQVKGGKPSNNDSQDKSFRNNRSSIFVNRDF